MMAEAAPARPGGSTPMTASFSGIIVKPEPTLFVAGVEALAAGNHE